jgi:hypothetical protein
MEAASAVLGLETEEINHTRCQPRFSKRPEASGTRPTDQAAGSGSSLAANASMP